MTIFLSNIITLWCREAVDQVSAMSIATIPARAIDNINGTSISCA